MPTDLLKQSGKISTGPYPKVQVNDYHESESNYEDRVGRRQPCIFQPCVPALVPDRDKNPDNKHKGCSPGDILYGPYGGLLVHTGLGWIDAGRLLGRCTHVEIFSRLPIVAPAAFNSSTTLTITDPADAPADADALRDDLVANTIPDIETDVAAAMDTAAEAAYAAALAIVNQNAAFKLVGTNAATGTAAFAAGGGISLTTDTASADQMVLVPNDGGFSPFDKVGWNTAKRPIFDNTIKTAATITLMKWWCGLRLTNQTPFDLTTDANQMIVWYDTTVDGYLHWSLSIGGVDTTGILTDASGNKITVTASTFYHVQLYVDENRLPYFAVNGVLNYAGTAAMTSLTTLKPHIGVQTATTAARALTMLQVGMSKDWE